MNSYRTRREYLKKVSLGLAAGVMGSVLPTHADAPSEARVTPPEILKLDTLDDKGLTNIANDIYRERDAVMQPLVNQLISPTSTQDVKIYAAVLLGEYRLSDAASALVDNITLRVTDTSRLNNYAISLFTEFPAQTALYFIGSECVRSVIGALATQNDPLRRYLLLDVLRSVYQYPECVKIVLQHALSEEKDAARKKKLREALVSFIKPPPIETLRKLLERHEITPT